MTSEYQRLIDLASEVDTPASPRKLAEFSTLLSRLQVEDIQEQHVALVDDLISILHNTANLNASHCEAVIALQDKIRNKRCVQNGPFMTPTHFSRRLLTGTLVATTVLCACSYTKTPSIPEQGSSVGMTGDIGFTHEPLSANKHLLTVTAAPGLMETEGSIAQRIHIAANRFAAKACPATFEFVHDPNFSQSIAGGFMKRTRTYVFTCRG